MNGRARPRRSALYMPGSNARALDKARGLAADVLILDLEDSVAPDAKAAARGQVVAALAAGSYGDRELMVRVNGLDTAWGAADLAALLADGNAYFYVCGLKSMEEGVLMALRDVAQQAGLNWDELSDALRTEGRLHLETY